jgi:hypothetical protein
MRQRLPGSEDGRSATRLAPELVLAVIGSASLTLLLVAFAKLRELGHELSGSDREERSRIHSALGQLDD